MPIAPDTIITCLHNPATGLFYPAVFQAAGRGPNLYRFDVKRNTGLFTEEDAKAEMLLVREYFWPATIVNKPAQWDGRPLSGAGIGPDLSVQRLVYLD